VAVAILACLSLYAFGDESADRRKVETTAKADPIFGRRYSAEVGRPLRLHDEQTTTGPPDEVIYWHGANYVVDLMFAADGTVAALVLLPEALLYSNDWNDVPDGLELFSSEKEWFTASANALQPLGKKDDRAVRYSVQSGKNLYSGEGYALASVSYYENEQRSWSGLFKPLLKDIQITYRQAIEGVVEDVRVEIGQRQIKVHGQWYHGDKPGQEIFDTAQTNDFVRFGTNGCTANEKACLAAADDSGSATEP